MKRTFILFVSTVLMATGISFGQVAESEEEYNIYFHNNETQLLQYRKPKEWLLGTVLAATGTTIQLGYSPIPFLSVDAAYLTNLVKARQNGYDKEKNAFSFSVGTYWFLENKRLNIREAKRTPKSIPTYGLLLYAKAGYSNNKMNIKTGQARDPFFISTETEYTFHTLFANLNLGYQHSWGMLTLTGSIQNVEFNKLSFSGDYPDADKLRDIVTQLRQQSNYNVFSLGVHNELGRRNVRVLAGGSFPLIYFQDFINQAAEIERPYMYAGVMFHLSNILTSNKSRKQK
jgi:hypothetical protein